MVWMNPQGRQARCLNGEQIHWFSEADEISMTVNTTRLS
jgi:hypothetical protein